MIQTVAWLDTKKASIQLGVSHRKLLSMLDNEKITYKDNQNIRKVFPDKTHLARTHERSWIHKDATSYNQTQYYQVIQLSTEGVEVCKKKLTEIV